jgi:acetyl esterase/lipase
VQVGEDEVLVDDATRLAEQAAAAHVEVTLEVWPGMWHIFQTQPVFPEARAAFGRFATYLRRHLVAAGIEPGVPG